VVPPAYESVPSSEGKGRLKELLESGEIDCVTFTASSTVENFVRAFGGEAEWLLSKARVACIGPITARTARGNGLRVDAEAGEYTIPGLVNVVVHLLTAKDTIKKGG
jgi:uroporphyrinogen III methyltransferase/synthase